MGLLNSFAPTGFTYELLGLFLQEFHNILGKKKTKHFLLPWKAVPPADEVEIAVAAKPGVAPLKRTGMASAVTGLGLGTAGLGDSRAFRKQGEVLPSTGGTGGYTFCETGKVKKHWSLSTKQTAAHPWSSLYTDPLPSQTFSTLVKLEMKIPQHGAKYRQDKFSQLSLTLDKGAAAEFICCRFWKCSF